MFTEMWIQRAHGCNGHEDTMDPGYTRTQIHRTTNRFGVPTWRVLCLQPPAVGRGLVYPTCDKLRGVLDLSN